MPQPSQSLGRPLLGQLLLGQLLLGQLLLLTVLAGFGCATYRFGSGTLYRSDIRTVHVPMFQSYTLRRYWGELLTEAVVKEIELKSPYKVVSAANADSTLTGRIIDVRKRVLAEDANDLPRDIEVNLAVQIEWRDRQGRQIVQAADVPIPGFMLNIQQAADFVPEAGQTLATAEIETIQKMAAQIVSQMEMRW